MNMKSFFTTKRICRAAIVAALYAALAMVLAPISYGEFQCRVSEALTVLPLFFPEAVAGLAIGCLIANLIGNGILDLVFGTLTTLFAALTTYFIGRLIKRKIVRLVLGEIPPILFNAIVVPFTYLAVTDLKSLYLINALWIGLGQLVAVAIAGTVLYFAVLRLRKKNVSFFSDKKEETNENKLFLAAALLCTLGIVLPCAGAIVAYFFEVVALSYALLAIAAVVLVFSVVFNIVKSIAKRGNS